MKTLCIISFFAFLVLATIKGQEGKIGYAIGYAVISLADFILAVAFVLRDNIKDKEK